jgi:hypothetical protein
MRFPMSPPRKGERLTVPEALSCSKEFDMIASASWVSQSVMWWLWLWKWLFCDVAGSGRDFVEEVKSELLEPLVAATVSSF